MKYACFLILTLIIACGSPDKKLETVKTLPPPAPKNGNYLLEPNSIDSLVKVNHAGLKGPTGNFASYKNYLAGLKDNNAASIPYALDYINTCLPANLTEKDSVLLLFNIKFYKVTNLLSEGLETKYAKQIQQLDKYSTSQQLVAFKNNLKDCGIGIFSTEGNFYLDVLPDYLYNNFKNRVSAGVKDFLDIRRHELAEGFSEDAGLLISFDQLYQRVKRWEKHLAQYPLTVYNAEADGYYGTYLQTLLTGMDNSRVFDMQDNSITPEVKAIYEKAIKQDQGTQAAKIITDYYNLLSRHQFKENDSIAVFLKERKLSTMLAVQPDTR